MAGLTVVSVSLGPPGDDGSRLLRARVRNDEPEQVHVVSDATAVEYDPAARRLVVRFEPIDNDPAEPEVRIISTHPFVPEQVVLAPGEEHDVVALVPPVIYKSRTGGTMTGLGTGATPVGEIDEVEVTVAHNPTPFQPPLDLEPDERLRRMRREARVSTERVVPARTDELPESYRRGHGHDHGHDHRHDTESS